MNERQGQRIFNRYVDIVSDILSEGAKPDLAQTIKACDIVNKFFEDESIIFIDALSNDEAHIKLGDELYVSPKTGTTYWIPPSDLPYDDEG